MCSCTPSPAAVTCTRASPERRIRTPTRTDAVLAIERDGEAHRIACLRRGTRLAPRILERGPAGVRAALLATQAGPLAGDRDGVRIVVGAGATLVVEPVAATLALPGPSTTRLRLDVRVEQGGRLVLDEGPLIVAAGAHVERRCTIELDEGAVAAVRETVVLGRDGEAPGALDSSLRVLLAGRVLVHDGLRMRARTAAYVALAPGHRVAATACLLGIRDPTGMQLEGPGAMLRATGHALAEVERTISPAWIAWSDAAVRPLVPAS